MAGTKPGHDGNINVAHCPKCKLLLRNCLHHAAQRTRIGDWHLRVLDQRLVIFGQRLERRLGFHLHDLVAAGLQPAEQRRQGFRGRTIRRAGLVAAFAASVSALSSTARFAFSNIWSYAFMASP